MYGKYDNRLRILAFYSSIANVRNHIYVTTPNMLKGDSLCKLIISLGARESIDENYPSVRAQNL